MLKKLALSSLLITNVFAYHQAELNLNNKDLGVKLNFDMGQFNENVDADTTFVGFRYLNANASHSAKVFTDDISLLEMNFLRRQAIAGLPDLVVGIGLRVDGTTINTPGGVNDSLFVSVPFGIDVTYHIPVDVINMYVGANAYYAPEVLSFYDATNFKEFNGYIALEMIEGVSIKAGYRSLDLNYQNNINRSAYAGLNFSF